MLRRRRLFRRIRLIVPIGTMALAVLAPMLGGGAAAASPAHVDLLPTTGTVDNVMAGYIADGIARAQSEGASALIIELNTPGGSLDATTRIVSFGAEVWASIPGTRYQSLGRPFKENLGPSVCAGRGISIDGHGRLL